MWTGLAIPFACDNYTTVRHMTVACLGLFVTAALHLDIMCTMLAFVFVSDTCNWFVVASTESQSRHLDVEGPPPAQPSADQAAIYVSSSQPNDLGLEPRTSRQDQCSNLYALHRHPDLRGVSGC